ncbi:3-deoxy-manno-octulosonate cytidylyltransferase (CMP-KDO synthetase) [Kaistia hirudinis]|uniref:3-deoxy-manno-octulosonate cytidylyltransferase n=2 Tax=Kaistia hirudinis TaxID=1293440 RepID=A0A840AWM3_9HYPH|nr:3-deoxy-manno-octulosonate cytidylyltransferase (CMP-KDO synthetase) [Kaistia hirudinis]
MQKTRPMTHPNRAIVLVPARMASTRLPGKPLADIHGEPMIVHVWRRACEAEIGPVVVATDDEDIASAVRAAGGEAVMTRADHPNGSSRIHEAVGLVDPGRAFEVVVNVQGDLPTIEPDSVRAAFRPLADPVVDIGTIAAFIEDAAERTNESVVKIVGSPKPVGGVLSERQLRALYFTRATAPWGEGPLYHHIGLYAYRRAALDRYVGLLPSVLETRERLEQLRALEAGMRIDVEVVDAVPLGVDTPADLEKARLLLDPRAPKRAAGSSSSQEKPSP